VAAEALESSVLESKDKDQLLAIAKALGVKASARTKKSELIEQILESTGSPAAASAAPAPAPDEAPAADDGGEEPAAPAPLDAAPAAADGDRDGDGDRDRDGDSKQAAGTTEAVTPAPAPARLPLSAPADTRRTGRPNAPARTGVALGADGEPLAEWELQLGDTGEQSGNGARATGVTPTTHVATDQSAGSNESEGEGRNRRRRRRRKGGSKDVPDGLADDAAPTPDDTSDHSPAHVVNDPVEVAGYLDMRDEGYGFLRVNGYLSSRDDAYVPVKLARQYGLRRGDHVVGLSRPAARNEKNPALLDVSQVNGGDPNEARRRPRFEDLTALYPDSRLRLEDPTDATNMTARIIDLIAPIGKGQRGIIVSPPKAGKTTVLKTIAKSIEKNHPEVTLIVLLIDERPEEVTDMRRAIKGEVVASTFDRPSEEHTHVAELVIEKAKRLVEQGQDVVVMLDGITRLSRAYNLAAPTTGKILSGGIDAGALYPPKKFFGAARNVEEGGSLTILATALVDTNSRMDEAIFEEFKGTGNMELRLDRQLAERRVYPAIDVDGSSTRHEELLFDRKQLQLVWKLRRVLSGLAADSGTGARGIELLVDRLKGLRTNAEFLDEIAKQPGGL
jgi:transcription termination factor Rho